jgi:hypothetical protein
VYHIATDLAYCFQPLPGVLHCCCFLLEVFFCITTKPLGFDQIAQNSTVILLFKEYTYYDIPDYAA